MSSAGKDRRDTEEIRWAVKVVKYAMERMYDEDVKSAARVTPS